MIAIIFPGQGSQYIGMGEYLIAHFPDIVNILFEEAEHISNIDVRKICLKGTLMEQNDIINMLLCILTIDVAAFQVFVDNYKFDKNEVILAGHSLGEYAALVSGGVMSFQNAINAVMLRGEIAQHYISSKNTCMSVIEGVSGDIIKDICDIVSDNKTIVDVSCYNSSKQTVISGHNAAVEKAERILKKIGGKITPNPYMAPFHTRILKNDINPLSQLLNNCNYSAPKHVILSNYLAAPFTIENIAHCLKSQFINTVRWKETIDNIVCYPLDSIIEVGPRSILLKTINDDYPTVNTLFYPLDNKLKIKHIQDIFIGNRINIVKLCCKMAVCAANKCKDLKEYNEGVVEPYKKMLTLLKTYEISINKEELEKEAIELLLYICKTKMMSQEEIERRMLMLKSIRSCLYID